MMEKMSRALVPALSRLPMVLRQRIDQAQRERQRTSEAQDFDLVRFETHLKNRSQVERFLPDILGRALARIWIDQTFRLRFSTDPKGTLSDYGVHLPETITIDFVTEGTIRPQVVVYERLGPGLPPRRLLYLQLVMMAGK